MTSAYKNVSDSYFAMPYLDITADSTTAFTAPELSDGMYVLSDYIKSVRSSTYTTDGAVDVPGVICDFSCTDTTLNIRLHNTAPVTRKAVFDTSLFQLKTRVCGRDITSKVSVINPDTGVNTDFYLSAWGQAVTTPPSDRIAGKWVSVAYNSKEAAIDTAKKEFEKNQDTHKVEFYSKLQLPLMINTSSCNAAILLFTLIFIYIAALLLLGKLFDFFGQSGGQITAGIQVPVVRR